MIIVCLAFWALASAPLMGVKGNGDFSDLGQLWAVVDEMAGGHHKETGRGAGLEPFWEALADLKDKGTSSTDDKHLAGGDCRQSLCGGATKKEEMELQHGLEYFMKPFMDKKEESLADNLWIALGEMRDKEMPGQMENEKDDTDFLKLFSGMRDKGVDKPFVMGDHEEQMKQMFKMMVSNKQEMGDTVDTMGIIARARDMAQTKGMTGDMDEQDEELKTRIFKIMLFHKVAKHDFDGIMKLMIIKKKRSSQAHGKTLSEAEVEEYEKKVFQMLVAQKTELGDEEGLGRLLLWHKKKVDQKAHGGMSLEMEVKVAFLQIVAMNKIKEGDMEGLKKILDWIKMKEVERNSGKEIEYVEYELYALAKTKCGRMDKTDMKGELKKTLMLIDKLEQVLVEMDQHRFLHLVDKRLEGDV